MTFLRVSCWTYRGLTLRYFATPRRSVKCGLGEPPVSGSGGEIGFWNFIAVCGRCLTPAIEQRCRRFVNDFSGVRLRELMGKLHQGGLAQRAAEKNRLSEESRSRDQTITLLFSCSSRSRACAPSGHESPM